ncbi:MAG: cation:proton antiporter [Vulcanimicrobiaceae bacterium]
MGQTLAHYPSLAVELGAVFVLLAALSARYALRRFGIPSLITLLAFGLLAGPSGLGWFHIDLTNPSTRALLSLAVVIVLFEATLRMNLDNIPKATFIKLVLIGPALALLVLPRVGRAFGLTQIVADLVAAVCVVTGPTVTGPLLARLRFRPKLSHLLETEGLVLDATGVVVTAAVFAAFTTEADGRWSTTLEGIWRLGLGVLVGLAVGIFGRWLLPRLMRLPSDVGKLAALAIGFGAYALAELVAHESGLTAVIACGLVLDIKSLTNARPLQVFKEDLSMLALSTVFVLLSSQIDIHAMGPLLGVGAALVATLLILRAVTVLLATLGSGMDWRERLATFTMFPRGIVAVSLATYYATQLPAWGIRGGEHLAGTLFLVIVATVILSTIMALGVAAAFDLQAPGVALAGIDERSLAVAGACRLRELGVLMLDDSSERVDLALAHDFDAAYVADARQLLRTAREHHCRVIALEAGDRWQELSSQALSDHSAILAYPRDEELRSISDRIEAIASRPQQRGPGAGASSV